MPDPELRQPVHTLYGGAHLFRAATCRKLGALAEQSLDEYAPDAEALAAALELPRSIAQIVYDRVREKLRREPVEDFRIDFEDGYGFRAEPEEDAAAVAAAAETAHALDAGDLPPFFGIRIKALDLLSPSRKGRGLRTLELFMNALIARTGGRLPDNFVVTLPKIAAPEQVGALVRALEPFPGARLEIMIETPQAVTNLPSLVNAAQGLCVAAHFGPYDYTASLGVTAASQSLQHPACDFARSMMLVYLAGTGLSLADGPTTFLPIPPHRPGTHSVLSESQARENRAVVHQAWKLHYDNVRRALHNGFYRGWDLHPAQLPARYASVFSFFLEGLDAASARLRNFIDQATQATRAGAVFDDAATGQGLLNYFRLAAACGAVPEAELPALTGLTVKEIQEASFTEISDRRRKLI
jgi:citrate lyase beta subunit